LNTRDYINLDHTLSEKFDIWIYIGNFKDGFDKLIFLLYIVYHFKQAIRIFLTFQ